MSSGGGKTPERLVQLMKGAVEKSSQSAVARATGLTQPAVGRYIKGIGEPTQASLEKLAAYFRVSVAWLRGEPESREITTQELQVLAEIREALGVGNRPMLSELPGIVRAMREELEGLRNG